MRALVKKMCARLGLELGLLIVFLLVAWVLSTLAAWYAWHYQDTTSDPLYDALFQIFPDLSETTVPYPNYVGFLQMGVAVMALKEHQWGYIAQFLFLNGVLLVVRSLTTTSTLLPNIHVYDYCREVPETYFDVVRMQIEHGTCADYMFSGHTATVFLLYMFTHRHKYSYAFEVVSGLLVGLMMLSLILLRWHYTSDILVAVVFTWLLFKYYKDYEETDMWFYFPELKKYNWRCNRSYKTRRVDYSIVN